MIKREENPRMKQSDIFLIFCWFHPFLVQSNWKLILEPYSILYLFCCIYIFLKLFSVYYFVYSLLFICLFCLYPTVCGIIFFKVILQLLLQNLKGTLLSINKQNISTFGSNQQLRSGFSCSEEENK